MLKRLKRSIKNKISFSVVIDDANLTYHLWILRLFNQIESVPGHIAEIGVASGRNSVLFGKLIKLYGQQDVRKYFGFDTFEGFNERDLNANRHLQNDLWQKNQHTLNAVNKRLKNNGLQDVCSLIKGDAVDSTKSFLTNFNQRIFRKECPSLPCCILTATRTCQPLKACKTFCRIYLRMP